MGLAFEDLVRLRDNALKKGNVPIGWQLSIEGLRQLSQQNSPDPRDRYADGQPLTLLGLPYSLNPTRSGAQIEILVRSD